MPRFRAHQEAKAKEGVIILFYVAHKYQGNPKNIVRAKKITHDLQVSDIENAYLCPLLALSHLKYGELGFDEELDICIDMLQMCDCLIVASEISPGVQREIDFANLVGMEVLDLAEKYREI